MKKITFIFLLVIVSQLCLAQNMCKEDFLIYDQYVKKTTSMKNEPIGDLMVITGKTFIGKPYVAATLEKGEKETLIVNFRELDCTTFVETCIALCKDLKEDDTSFDKYKNWLIKLRYRGGKIDGYTSRLHYSSDWVYENKDIFSDITKSIGGQSIVKPLNFMSTKSDLYPRLKGQGQGQEVAKMAEIEASINTRNSYVLLPVTKIKATERQIKNGDIILLGTKTAGLDYSHMGLAVWENGKLMFLHASSAENKVIVDKKTLVEYCTNSKTCSGITVLRLNE